MRPSVRFLRDEQNPRWDDRQLHNWLDREVRFDAAFRSLRVICRIPRRDFIEAFGPTADDSVFEVFEQHRAAIEAAALAKLHQDAYATDINWGEPNTVSIVVTGPDIQGVIAAKRTLGPSTPAELAKPSVMV